jgi:redox-sensing transcriptional repressor
MVPLRRLVLDRLIRYYWRTDELARTGHPDHVTSTELGELLDIDPSQVRRDFAAIGLSGRNRVGYRVADVCRVIRSRLGFDRPFRAVLVGTGHLGRALLEYPGFARYGLRIVAVFDVRADRVGQRMSGLVSQPMDQLTGYLARSGIPVAILTTSADAAQGAADLLVAGGISVIWNFTSTRLAVPPGVLARNERLETALAQIAHTLRSKRPDAAAAPDPRYDSSSPEGAAADGNDFEARGLPGDRGG